MVSLIPRSVRARLSEVCFRLHCRLALPPQKPSGNAGPGEGCLTRAAVNGYSPGFISSLNAGKKPEGGAFRFRFDLFGLDQYKLLGELQEEIQRLLPLDGSLVPCKTASLARELCSKFPTVAPEVVLEELKQQKAARSVVKTGDPR